MKTNAKIDALQLMLRDLSTRNAPIRHKAAFRGCQPEFHALVSKLISQLESELSNEKQILREEQIKPKNRNSTKNNTRLGELFLDGATA